MTETKEDVSYGVIPYRCGEKGLEFLVIYQYSSLRDDIYWIFPKGHAEAGESPEDTAKRELREETQIELEHIHTEHPFTLTYDFEHNDTRIQKKVIFFLGKVASGEVVLQEDEVKDAGWFHYETAWEKLSYENSKAVLDSAVRYLKERANY